MIENVGFRAMSKGANDLAQTQKPRQCTIIASFCIFSSLISGNVLKKREKNSGDRYRRRLTAIRRLKTALRNRHL